MINSNMNNSNSNNQPKNNLNSHDVEDGELNNDEFHRADERLFLDYSNRVPMSNWSCKNVESYEKVDQVGEGTFGKVYKARYKSSNKNNLKTTSEFVALKKILVDNEKEGFPLTAIREIMILKRLNHKNIINLLEIVTSKPSQSNRNRGNVYLVFDYMEHDLSGLICRKYDFTLAKIKCILKQILLGLEYLHDHNIIHRDIKGANILINNKGEVKLADFGLARLHNPNQNINKIYTNRVVTLWYRSPELLLGATNYGPAIDMWSVGCVFSELLEGISPFRGQKENEQIEKIFEKCGTPNEETWPGVTSLRYYNNLAPKTIYPNNVLKICYSDNKKVDATTFDLLSKMLELDPKKRINCKEALNHKFFSDSHHPKALEPQEWPIFEKDSHEYQSRINRKMQQQQQQQQQAHINQQNNNYAHPHNNHNRPNIPNVQRNQIHPINYLEKPLNNIFVTSNTKINVPNKEDATLHVSKLNLLVSDKNNHTANGEENNKLETNNFLGQKRILDINNSNENDINNQNKKQRLD